VIDPDTVSTDTIATPARKGGLLARLSKTREALARGFGSLFGSTTSLDETFFEDLEDQLLLADVGVEASRDLVARIRASAAQHDPGSVFDFHGALRQAIVDLLQATNRPVTPIGAVDKPLVIMMVGVNGVGKTTTVAKLARHLSQQNLSLILAACDTYRAAATEQLKTWGERLELPVVAQGQGADAAAVAHDALVSATAKAIDVLIIDTAGRQHTHTGLMDQLVKTKRVVANLDAAAPHEIWITVDAGNGQNVLSQVEQFHSRLGLSGICVTKLDGTAKGGIVIGLSRKFDIPIRYIGVGEGIDDLRPFDAAEFAEALAPHANPADQA
jgi:fused signal recognition particle receptor